MNFQDLLKFAVENDASDVHIQASVSPMLRIAGQIRSTESPPLTDEQARGFIAEIAPARHRNDLDDAIVRGLDFSYAIPGLSRFRCSAYSQLGKVGMVMRIIRTKIPSIEELNLPKVVRDIALARRGLTLLTGTTGSGKSTTLAAMIDLINPEPKRYPRAECEFVGEKPLCVENAVAVGVIQNLDARHMIARVCPAMDVVVVFNHPNAAASIEGERDGFADIGFGCEDTDFKIRRDIHLRDRFLRFEEGRVTRLLLAG